MFKEFLEELWEWILYIPDLICDFLLEYRWARVLLSVIVYLVGYFGTMFLLVCLEAAKRTW